MMKKKFIFFISIYFLFIFSFTFANEENKKISIRPKNTIDKINFIKKNLEINKKYKVSDNILLFKKILIAKWIGPPHAVFTFKNNGHYVMLGELSGNFTETGLWKIKGNNLMLKKNNGIWKSNEIEYFKLIKKIRRKKIRYTVIVNFKQRLNGLSDGLVIKFIYE